jgi:excisionase family DNA binding protein
VTTETRETTVPSLLTCREAAALARVSRVHVWRLIQRGEVPAIRVGEDGPIRVEREPFLEWLFGVPRAAAAAQGGVMGSSWTRRRPQCS